MNIFVSSANKRGGLFFEFETEGGESETADQTGEDSARRDGECERDGSMQPTSNTKRLAKG